MKVQLIRKKERDSISYSGNIISVEGLDYDFENLPVLPDPVFDDEENCLNEEEIIKIESGCFYKDERGNSFGKISVSVSDGSSFLAVGNEFKDAEGNKFVCQNLYLFYDLDCDCDFSLSELKKLIDSLNMTKEKRAAYHDKIKSDFGWPEGKTLSQLPEDQRIAWLMRGVVIS